MKTLVIFLIVMIGEYLVSEYLKQVALNKRRELYKVKAEINAQRKKEAFEEYRRYVEDKFKEEEIDIKEVQEDNVISYVEGVQRLRDNGHKYVPYERPNPLSDIRNSLSEFTVSDVLNTFYF